MNSPGHTKPNRLAHATSPYLLQHAHNPVDWYEWSVEALDKAKSEDKPVLVSIGYSSCHWCHVMERESFENPDIATLMNEFFVCIKVDREERPDIDQVYMEAVQAMGMNGGWPLNVFLTPDQKPFYGGTYFPPQAWAQLLTNISKAYHSKRNEIDDTARELTTLLASADISRFKQQSEQTSFKQNLEQTYLKLEKKFDRVWGGLDKAPKFIMPSIWLWLLRYPYLVKNENALAHLQLTLKQILYGGIYDQIGGAFARYSVDNEWFAPHFEKMLYDNAQLISLYSEAYQVTKDNEFKQAVYETFEWLKREMTHPDGGFYSAMDADSEGMEGKFYVWTHAELSELLGEAAQEFNTYYSVTPQGNWEHGFNILHRKAEAIPPDNLSQFKTTLLKVRNKRMRPGLDDKILCGWNAMTVCGLVDAYHAFKDRTFLDAGIKNMRFILHHLTQGEVLFRSWKGKRSATEGFLEDYAYVIQACIKLYEADFNEEWIRKAERFSEYVLSNFYDPTDGFFFYTSRNAEQLIARKKEIFDNVIPSSNSMIAKCLLHLGYLLDHEEWKNIARRMVNELSHLIISEPAYMSNWGIVYSEVNSALAEVVFVGRDCIPLKNQFREKYHPYALVMGTSSTSDLPLLQGKSSSENTTTIYVCYNKTCKLPVHTLAEAWAQLESFS